MGEKRRCCNRVKCRMCCVGVTCRRCCGVLGCRGGVKCRRCGSGRCVLRYEFGEVSFGVVFVVSVHHE